MSENNLKKDVLFIDVNSLMYRAYHASEHNKFYSKEGIPNNAINTLSRMILNLKSGFNNLVYGLSIFDGEDSNDYRISISDDYKEGRNPMPDDLKKQVPYIYELMNILGFTTYASEGVEADDVIGTLSGRASKAGFNVYIATSDKDCRQLVKDNVHIIDTKSSTIFTPEVVFETMKIRPDQVIDYLSIIGDKADNVIGVEKWGPVTTIKYLNQYGSLSGIIENAADIKGIAGDNLRDSIASGRLEKNVKLITLKTDLNISFSSKSLTVKEVDQDRWINFCSKLNLPYSLRDKPLRP